MSRMSSAGDTITVAPKNNVYTVLVIVGVLIEIIALIFLYMRANELGIPFWGHWVAPT